jgi:two-component system, cell cycle response regulator DivK
VNETEREFTHTVLLIEDNPNNARIMVRILERSNYRVLHAADGESGMELALTASPDIILLDLGLPDVDGQTIAAHLKHTAALPGIPVVIVTAWPSETAREMVSAYGCQGYIAKPIDTREFAQQVASYLAGVTK